MSYNTIKLHELNNSPDQLNFVLDTHFSFFFAFIRAFLLGLVVALATCFSITAQSKKLSAVDKIDAESSLPIKLCWEFETNNDSINGFASDKISNFYLIKNENTIVSLGKNNREFNWSFDVGGIILTKIVADTKNLFVVNTVKSNNIEKVFLIFRAIDKFSGLTEWTTEVEIETEFTENKPLSEEIANITKLEKPILYDAKDELLFSSSSCFININKLNGSVNWKKCIAKRNQSDNPSDVFEDVYVYSNKADINFASLGNGTIRWKIPVKDQVTAISLINKSTVIYGDKKGNLKSTDAIENRTVWKFKAGGEISNIVRIDRYVLVGSFDNFVYLLDAYNGRTIWRKRFANRITSKPIVSNKTAIIIDGEKKVFFIDILTGKITFQISLSPDMSFLTTPESFDDNVIFLTNKGLLAYGNNNCLAN